MGWLSGWSYRKTVSITGQTGAGTKYQVDFSIGDASGGDFHLESHCTSFPNDIQITDNDQSTTLDYWVEDLTVDPIKMWVEVADDLGTNADICIYYGKTGASTESNISNTFLFGDDFTGGTLDTVTNWNSYISAGCSISLSGGEATFTTIATSGDYHAAVLSKASFGVDTILEAKLKFSDTGNHARRYMTIGFGAQEGSSTSTYLKTQTAIDDSVLFIDTSTSNNNWYADFYENGAPTNVAVEAISTTYKKFTIERYNTNKARWLIDDVQVEAEKTTVPESAQIALGIDSLVIADTGSAFSVTVDYIFLRVHNSPEPAFSSAGSEEEAGVATYYFNSKSTSVWTNPEKMIDDILTNYAYTSSGGAMEVLDGNSGPGTNIGTITKVEIRAYAYGDDNDRIDFTPVFGGSDDGDEHQTTPGVSPGSWGLYQDITSDINHPSPWTWGAVQALDCKVEKVTVSKSNQMNCAKVEIKVTYTPPGEGVTRSYGYILG